MNPLYTLSHITDGLYLGAGRLAFYPEVLAAHHISHVLKLYPNHPVSPAWPDGLTILENPVNDDEPLPPDRLQQGVAFIREHLANNAPVLVVCSQGLSRAPAFGLAYLVSAGYDLPAAWKLVREQYPAARPKLPLWQSLLEVYELPYTLDDVKSWLANPGANET